jgi:hypothetical protein
MIGGSSGPRKLDLLKGSLIQAHANGLWPHLTAIERWPEWLREPRGTEGLERVERLPSEPGRVDPLQPELGRRYRFTFSNGFAGEFRVTYWLEPAQISLGLVPATRTPDHGVEGMIFDLDFFPQPDGATKLWFGALVMLEKGFRPSLFASWPRRDVQAWVDGFHARAVAQGPALARGVTTRRQMEAALGGKAP